MASVVLELPGVMFDFEQNVLNVSSSAISTTINCIFQRYYILICFGSVACGTVTLNLHCIYKVDLFTLYYFFFFQKNLYSSVSIPFKKHSFSFFCF